MDRSRVQIPRAVLEALLPHGAALQLFAWLLAHAHGEARDCVVKGRKLHLLAGEVVLGARSVGRELGLTHKAMRCALELLERKTFICCRGAHSGAQLGAHNGAVVSLMNPESYFLFSNGEGHTMGPTNGHTMAKDGAQLGAHLAPEKVPVIEPPYQQNGEAMGHTMGHTSPGKCPENGPDAAENGGATNKDINISLKNTSYPNSKGSSKERNLKVYSAIFEDEPEAEEEPGTLRGRKYKISGKRAEAFLEFWEAFAYKRDRAQAIDAWAMIEKLTTKLMREKILPAARHYAQVERPQIIARGGTPKFAQGWINDRRWEDECQIPPEEDYSFLERFGGSA